MTPWTIEQLRTLVEVVNTGSFTRAGEALNLSQPAVSMQIRSLERNLGVTLLERRPRRVLLTDAGRIVFGYAGKLSHLEAECRAELADLGALRGGTLRLGAGATPSIFTLAAVFAEFYRRWPDVELKVQIGRTSELVAGVLKDDLDMAIVSSGIQMDSLDQRPIYQESCVAIVGATHALAASETVSVRELARYPLVMLPAESGLRRFLENELARREIVITASMELASLEAIKEVVRSGVLVSIVPETAVGGETVSGGIKALGLSGVDLRRQTVAVRRSDKYVSEAMRAFYGLLEERWPDSRSALEQGRGRV